MENHGNVFLNLCGIPVMWSLQLNSLIWVVPEFTDILMVMLVSHCTWVKVFKINPEFRILSLDWFQIPYLHYNWDHACFFHALAFAVPSWGSCLKIYFFLHWNPSNKMASGSNFWMQHFCKQKHQRSDQSRPQLFPLLRHVNSSGLILSIYESKPMFKQHEHPMIWTWIFFHLAMASNRYVFLFCLIWFFTSHQQSFS